MAIALAIPSILVMFLLNHQSDTLAGVTKKELAGTVYTRSLFVLLTRAEAYRDAVSLPIPPTSGIPSLAQARTDLDTAVVSVNRAAIAAFKTEPLWTDVLRAWARAHADRPGASGSNETALIVAIDKLIEAVADRSYLSYDSQVDVQSLADVVSFEVPRSLDALSSANRLTIAAAISKRLSIPDRLALNAARTHFAARTQGVLDDIRVAGEVDPRIPSDLATPAGAALQPIRAFNDFLDQRVVEREHIVENPLAVDKAARAALVGIENLNDIVAPRLDGMLQSRLLEYGERKFLTGLAACVAFIVGFFICLQVVRNISKRDRQELERAREQAAFLSAELARQQAERALELSEAQFRAVFNDAAIGIAILDKRARVLESNPAFLRILGTVPPSPRTIYGSFFEGLGNGGAPSQRLEHPITLVSGEQKWIDATLSAIHHDAASSLVVWMLQDVTERKKTEQRLLHDATHDTLTGLANRSSFEERLSEALAAALRNGRPDFAVLFVDLDHFKDINDSFGHAMGDAVLRTIAHRLRVSVGVDDVVARFGGDEFAILLRGVVRQQQIESIGRRIQRNLEEPLTIEGRMVFTTASIGITRATLEYTSAGDMLRDADTAMYSAKSGGRARYLTFDSLMHARAEERVRLASDLRSAVARAEFHVVYQPIVRIDDATMVGCEALVRWTHPQHGTISPANFIPFAEQIGLTTPIGRFVFRSACEQLVEWSRLDSGRRILMNVNVSVSELFAPDFENNIVAVTEEAGIDPSAITFEITESAILDRETRANDILVRLQRHGYSVCIDDFGTGYSSLRYLQDFKIDCLKIDRSFVARDDGELASPPIVQTLIKLAEAFGVRVVAEGVETEAQRRALRELGCQYAQGYLFARPQSGSLLLPV